MLAGDTAELRKARGAFFTPAALCNYVSSWAIRSPDDQILEPACGEAAFLLAAGIRLNQLQAGLLLSSGRIHGFEVHGASAESASATLGGAKIDAEITTADFLDVEPQPRFDAVIGNPPYVRYQEWQGEARTKARAAALRAGVALTNLASSWAAFVIHSSLFLRPGGRLGLVLPAELLSVNYAAPVRAYLMQRFGRVRLVLFEQRVFPGVLEEVVLLLADGQGPTSHCEVTQVRNLEELALVDGAPYRWTPVPANAKWSQALIPSSALAGFTELLGSPTFASLDEWGDTTLGMVTGANGYFAMTAPRVRDLKLRPSELLPLSPPGSRHLRGLSYTTKAWEEMKRDNAPVWLFRPSTEPSVAAEMYIEAGERDSVNAAFKCRVRHPWWRVPYLKPADLLLTYMNADTPRLCANRAGVHHLNSVHGLYVRPELRQLSLDLLPIAALNSLTVLAAEVMGRSYGGGMLKLEPREADTLPVPAPDFLLMHGSDLRALRPQLGTALRNGRIEDAITLVDEVLLCRGLGMKRAALKTLVGARQLLARRRNARGEAPRGAR